MRRIIFGARDRRVTIVLPSSNENRLRRL